jgi:sarcosine oxidase subunit gamma
VVDPKSFLWRTPLRRSMPNNARWRASSDSAVVERIDEGEAPLALATADLSPLPRVGFKGPGTLPAMGACGVRIEAAPNRAFRQADGSACLVLGPGEVLLLGALERDSAPRFAELERNWSIEDANRIYPMPRRDSHVWFAVAGTAAPEMFAKLCGVDLRLNKFVDLAIAQTSVARLNAIIVRIDRDIVPVFHLLADSTAAAYLLDCLLDAAEEFGGRLVGLGSLCSLSQRA